MSFILDALRKSETERQQQGSAEFAGVPTSAVDSGMPRWLWIVAALLAINLAVLLGLLMRPDAPGATPPMTVSAAAPETTRSSTPASGSSTSADARAGEDSFIEQLAAARQNPPPIAEEPEPALQEPARRQQVRRQPEPTVTIAAPVAAESSDVASLPSFVEVLTNGTVQLPDLHLDIHVYSEVPEDRFVFINMSKQRERSQLSEGPVVEEITPEGVILDYGGTRFLLSRD